MAPTETAGTPADQLITNGPALFYVTTPSLDGIQNVQRADLRASGDPRERAICRALLHHALALLDATEPTQTAGRPTAAGRLYGRPAPDRG